MIAIAATGETIDSRISDHAGRCPCYLLFDRTGVFIEAITNPSEESTGHAAPIAANFLARKGVTTLIAANFGQKMISELESLDIKHIIMDGKVRQALANLMG